jgi:predicted phosphohydrolase
MRKLRILFFIFFLSIQFVVLATSPFQFALFTDLHISVLKPQHAEDLQFAVDEVNVNGKIDFVLISGDDSDLGDLESLYQTKKILDNLKIPYYITSGNHDTHQGEIGSANFIRVFGKDTFSFSHSGYQFIGFPTGPQKGGNIGHIAAEDIDFVKRELNKTNPTFVITHYPLLKGDLDNYKEMNDFLQKFNVKAVLNGHYHRNALLNFDGIPGIVNRSMLRGTQKAGGYSIYSVSDSLKVSEKIIGEPERVWVALPLQN